MLAWLGLVLSQEKVTSQFDELMQAYFSIFVRVDECERDDGMLFVKEKKVSKKVNFEKREILRFS